jgi:hypothetical protein
VTKAVWKFELKPDHTSVAAADLESGMYVFEIEMPTGAEILRAGMDGGQAVPCIWAMCPKGPGGSKSTLTFLAARTGAEIDDEHELVYIDTFVPAANLVWHLFEVL